MSQKIAFLFSLLLLASWGCTPDPVRIPAYLRVAQMGVETNMATEGTSSSRITTAWVESDGEYLGAFELPLEVPVLKNKGAHTFTLYPGVNSNGIASLRSIYEFYNPVTVTVDLTPGKTTLVKQGTDSVIKTSYETWAHIDLVEDFESSGFGFVPTSRCDTFYTRTYNPDHVFPAPLNEGNFSSGVVYFKASGNIFEAESIETFQLPKYGANVYLEVNYKSTVPFVLGVFADSPGQTLQKPTATILPKKVWNKVYVNLLTEVSGTPDATGFRLFIGSIKSASNGKIDTLLLDNIKLVYRP